MQTKDRRKRTILTILSLLIVISMALSTVLTFIPPKRVTPTLPATSTPFPTRTPTLIPTP
ncbi:MAG: hypothetical protein GX620_14605 [Chloroflexi bacterium]|nr:hypothetical protein [Chloroflexota bacterium]